MPGSYQEARGKIKFLESDSCAAFLLLELYDAYPFLIDYVMSLPPSPKSIE